MDTNSVAGRARAQLNGKSLALHAVAGPGGDTEGRVTQVKILSSQECTRNRQILTSTPQAKIRLDPQRMPHTIPIHTGGTTPPPTGHTIGDPTSGLFERSPSEDNGDTDLAVFRAIQSQVQKRRLTGEHLLKKYPQLGLAFINSEYDEVVALVTRIAPGILRYLSSHYPLNHSSQNPPANRECNKGTDPATVIEVIANTPQRQTSDNLPDTEHEDLTQSGDPKGLWKAKINPPLIDSARTGSTSRIQNEDDHPFKLHGTWAYSRSYPWYQKISYLSQINSPQILSSIVDSL
uniref:Uncharacterized protein n=1 Tax=Physcomitrium patens TaxID=3218 RepID=A0A2K1IJM1_PHYPA|nr:hypothetical protein PHYPA_028161 [Physcomitrium patens]